LRSRRETRRKKRAAAPGAARASISKKLHLSRPSVGPGIRRNQVARVDRPLESGHAVMPVKLAFNMGRGTGEDQYLRRAGRAVPKPANHTALGNLTPVESSIARRTLRETRSWNINRLKPLFEPPGQPFAARKATPNRTIKTSANPRRNQAAGAVHGAHGFKRCAHASDSCLPLENLKPRFSLNENFQLRAELGVAAQDVYIFKNLGPSQPLGPRSPSCAQTRLAPKRWRGN